MGMSSRSRGRFEEIDNVVVKDWVAETAIVLIPSSGI
jgi:hypothetical protein